MKKILDLHKKIIEKIDNIKNCEEEKPISPKTNKHKDNTSSDNVIWIDIKSTTIIKIICLIILLFYMWSVISQLGTLILIILVSITLSAGISPIIDWFQKHKVPRALSITLIYTIMLGFLLVILTSLIPLIIDQLTNLANYLTNTLNNIQEKGIEAIPYVDFITKYVDEERLLITLQDSIDILSENIGNFSSNILSSLTSIFKNIISIVGYAITVFIATFFIVIDEDSFETFFLKLIPRKSRSYIKDVSKNIGLKLGAWLRGQIVLSFTIGAIAYIILSIIGVEYAFTIAIITAMTEFVPIIGPLIAAIPATLLAISQSATLGLVTLIAFLLLNTVESNIIAPLIMKKSVGLNPLAIILAMLIGYQIVGPIGIFLAIPMASAIMVVIDDYSGRVS